MLDKICKAAVEGKLIRKTLKYVFVKIPVTLVGNQPRCKKRTDRNAEKHGYVCREKKSALRGYGLAHILLQGG